jgi:hypothetical protein
MAKSMTPVRAILALLLLSALGGCATPTPPAAGCLFSNESKLLIAQLYFGRDIPGRGPLTDAEWSDFVTRVIAPNFPDGFTVQDGEGDWLDPQTSKLGREATKILIAAADPESEPAKRISDVIAAYRKEFKQESVGLVTQESCAAFAAP